MDKHSVIYFGYDTESAALNMAVDEVLENLAATNMHMYLRFYDTPNNAIVLSISDHPSVIRTREEDTEISRRITGGKPIFLSYNTLSYSIEAPIEIIKENKSSMMNPDALHKLLGEHMLEALKAVTGLNSDRIALGKVYSITVDGMPIAGHAQHISSKSFIYHGVVAIGRWDAEFISKRLILRKGDFEALSALPFVAKFSKLDVQTLKKMVIEEMLKTFDIKPIDTEEKSTIINKAKELKNDVYSNLKWVLRNDESLKKNSTFCLLYSG
ncbi:MAG: lipoate--protein ligase family protein [Candidatus Micrarchaeia archaeon]